jgi:glycosyltransferase involved in cell wall biosynthesis
VSSVAAGQPVAVDVLVDLSATGFGPQDVERLVARWTQPESISPPGTRVTLVAPPGASAGEPLHLPPDWVAVDADSSLDLLNNVLGAAGRQGRALLLLTGAVDVSGEAVSLLCESLGRDPLFGFAVPRIGCADGCCFASLSTHGLGEAPWVSRRVLAELPETELITEFLSPCVLIRPEVLANFGPLDCRFKALPAALLHYMAMARRCGFRVLLANRAVVLIDGPTCAARTAPSMAALSPADESVLRQLVPELQRGWDQFRGASWQRFERLASAAGTAKSPARSSMLLDMRNVPPSYNGTTQAALNTAIGFKKLAPDWDVAVLANDKAIAFHNLERIFSGWPIHTILPEGPFTATVRLSQPWHIQEMIDAHQVALFNAYLMLDTIAWDVVYPAPTDLDGIWHFLADHADALLFDSEFTRQRFLQRFPTGAAVPGRVTHFSFDPDEYVQSNAPDADGDEEFFLIVGNSYDHKDVRRTLETLTAGFPFHRIKVLGLAGSTSPFVTAYESGELSETDVHRLYASASCVVLPTFYEGFGFPLVTALSYGRTVLARRSSLVEELAAHCSPRGRLLTFDRREDLVDLVGRLVHRRPLPDLPVGSSVRHGRFRSWSDVARDILSFLEPLVRDPSSSRWTPRERVLRQLLSYRA